MYHSIKIINVVFSNHSNGKEKQLFIMDSQKKLIRFITLSTNTFV